LDSVFKSLNQEQHVGGISYDLAKTFGYANHEVLIAKLHFQAFKEQVQVGSDPI
jgi:hypothetical protein